MPRFGGDILSFSSQKPGTHLASRLYKENPIVRARSAEIRGFFRIGDRAATRPTRSDRVQVLCQLPLPAPERSVKLFRGLWSELTNIFLPSAGPGGAPHISHHYNSVLSVLGPQFDKFYL